MCCWQCGGRSEPWIAPVCCRLAPTSCSDHRRSSLRLVTKQWLPHCNWKNKTLISAMGKKWHAIKKWRCKYDERQVDQCSFAQHGSCKLQFQNRYIDKIWLSLSVSLYQSSELFRSQNLHQLSINKYYIVITFSVRYFSRLDHTAHYKAKSFKEQGIKMF